MRIAIFTLGSRGDVQPYVALAKEAIKCGHSAIICTGKTFETFIQSNGVEFKEAASDLMAMLKTEEGKMIFNHAMKHPIKTKQYLDKVVNPAFRQTLDQFWASAQGADVIIYHPKAFGAPDMAKALGVPCISMPPVPMTYPIEEFPNLAVSPTKNLGKIINKLTYRLMDKAESASIKEVNDFRQKMLNLPKRKSGEYMYAIEGQPIPIIYPISQTLFDEVKSWEGKVYLPGFFYLDTEEEQIEDRLQKFIDQGIPPIVVSFSSMPLKSPEKFKDLLIQALKATENRAVVMIGNSGMDFKDTDNIFTIQSAPHTLLFPQAKGIVHHGGVGTMAAALKSGKPQCIVPFAVDQPFWAHRLFEKGYALKPLKESELTVDALITRFREMVGPQVKQQAEAIQQRINQEDGLINAIKYIEQVVKKSG